MYKNDEEKALEETIKTFNGIKIIFEDNGITKIDEKILEICVQPFKGRSDSLKSELNILGDIFKVNVIQNICKGMYNILDIKHSYNIYILDRVI